MDGQRMVRQALPAQRNSLYYTYCHWFQKRQQRNSNTQAQLVLRCLSPAWRCAATAAGSDSCQQLLFGKTSGGSLMSTLHGALKDHGMKKCSRCNPTKPHIEFRRRPVSFWWQQICLHQCNYAAHCHHETLHQFYVHAVLLSIILTERNPCS